MVQYDQIPAGGHAIQPSGKNQRGRTGKLFDCNLIGAVTRRDGGGSGGLRRYEPIYGLALNLDAGDAAEITLISGAPYGGAQIQRVFTLTRQGVWMVAAGWATTTCLVSAVGDDDSAAGTCVTYTWTSHPPRPPSLLRLVQAVSATGAGGLPIPAGAVQVATAAPDAGWAYLTNQDGLGVLTMPQPAPGFGELERVLGARFVATVDNTLTWLLETQ